MDFFRGSDDSEKTSNYHCRCMIPLDFIFYMDNEWSVHYRPLERYDELAKRLAPLQGRVLCVNRPICPFTTPLLHFAKWQQWITARNHVSQLSDNLFLYTPYVLLHDLLALRVPGLPHLNHRLLARQVQNLLQRLGFRASERVAWVTDPRMFNYFGAAQETVRVYECIDQQRATVSHQRAMQKMERLEEKVCTQTDVVFCTALGLYKEKKQLNPNTYFMANAADTRLLSRVQDPQTPVAEYMRVLSHPIIGYLGTIHEHTDIALMRYVAEARPEWTIVMIGPEQQKSFSRSVLFTSFRQLPNVRLTGWVEREELPSYCKAFDVCVIPYRMDSEFNRYVNPDKLHEYMAMGKPVVSTDIPEVHSHRHIIKIAQTPEDFVHAIEESLAEEDLARVEERLRLAQENSWTKRAEQHLAIIEYVLTTKRVAAEQNLENLRRGR